MNNPHIKRNPENVLHITVADEIKKMIIEANMMPGDKLPTERELMTRFSVSRSTLREAIKILRAENVVIARQGSGTYVSDATGISADPLGLNFTDQDRLLPNLLESRLLIEPEIAVLAAQRAEPKDIEKLRSIVSKMDNVDSNDEISVELDIRFHTAISECTHNDVLIRVVPIIIESIRRGQLETADDEYSFELAKSAHHDILRSIENRDIMSARYFVERHIRDTIETIGY